MTWFTYIEPGGSDAKKSADNAGDPGWIIELGRFPGEGKGTPLQYSWLVDPVDRGSWQATVHGVPKRVGHDWATNTATIQPWKSLKCTL